MATTTTASIPDVATARSPLLRIMVILARVTLGVIFLYAAYTKVHFDGAWHLHDYQFLFAMGIDSYHILPLWGAEQLASVLPWFEMFLGAWLLSGIGLRWAGIVCTALIVVFLTAMIRAKFMGLEINCGCFGNNEKLGAATLIRDSSFLVLSLIATLGAFLLEKRKVSISR